MFASSHSHLHHNRVCVRTISETTGYEPFDLHERRERETTDYEPSHLRHPRVCVRAISARNLLSLSRLSPLRER